MNDGKIGDETFLRVHGPCFCPYEPDDVVSRCRVNEGEQLTDATFH